MPVFSVEDRQRVHDRVLELAAEDERVVAGAVVGSLADAGLGVRRQALTRAGTSDGQA
jgi:hypothetical protein